MVHAEARSLGTRLTGSGTSAYTYTSENRLATGPGGAALAYDSTGRLSQVYTAALSTNFDYDGAALIGERDAVSYGLLRRYVHGPGEDQPLVWYEGAGLTDKRYLMTDERGSVVAVTNGTGAASAINSYDEYGIPASTNVGRFGYTGQTWIPEIGLNYYKARMYSPTLGRFMQTDPIGYKDGVNWYDYVDGDPVNRSDPTGLSDREPLHERRAPPSGNSRSRIETARSNQRRQVAYAKRQNAAKTATGSNIVGATGTAKEAIAKAADNLSGKKGVGLLAVKGMAKSVSLAGAAIDAKSQLDGGKPSDEVAANVGGKMAFSTGVGTVGAELAPATAGASLVVGVIVIGTDFLLGGAVGDSAEGAYEFVRDNSSELGIRSPTVFPY